MTFWADNVKFIKDIQDSNYAKIEQAVDKVIQHRVFQLYGALLQK